MPFSLPIDGNRNPIPALRPTTTTRVAISATAALSSPVTEDTIMRVVADIDCFIAVGSNPTATNTSMFLPAKTPEYLKLAQTDRISALASSGTGNIYLTTAA